jgi:hypothetical protein
LFLTIKNSTDYVLTGFQGTVTWNLYGNVHPTAPWTQLDTITSASPLTFASDRSVGFRYASQNPTGIGPTVNDSNLLQDHGQPA